VAVLVEREFIAASSGRRVVVEAHAALFQITLRSGSRAASVICRFAMRSASNSIISLRSVWRPFDESGVVLAGEGIVVAADRLDTRRELTSGWAVVALNIRCSRKWAMPTCPADRRQRRPDYQTMWVTTGRGVGDDHQLQPVARVKLVALAANFGGSAASAIAALAAISSVATAPAVARFAGDRTIASMPRRSRRLLLPEIAANCDLSSRSTAAAGR